MGFLEPFLFALIGWLFCCFKFFVDQVIQAVSESLDPVLFVATFEGGGEIPNQVHQ